MPIQVTCSKCKKSFHVSEKFAGKEGPCPSCKAKIKIPDAPAPEIVIHEEAPVGASAVKVGGSGGAGARSTRPIARKETALNPVSIVLGVVGVAVVVVVAYILRDTLKANLFLRAIGLALTSIPIARGGYAFLREEELEPHQGLVLWIRSAICGLLYAALWGAMHFVLPLFASDAYAFAALVPAGLALAVGGGIAFASLDLDYGNGFIHCCFFTLTSLALGYLIGLDMPWTISAPV